MSDTMGGELFVTNNWFSFFPSDPEWYCEVLTARDLHVWNDNDCFMQMGFMLWIAHKQFREIISHYLPFQLSDRPCKHRALSLIPERIAFRFTRSTQDGLLAGLYAHSPHKPWWKRASRAFCFCTVFLLVFVHHLQGTGALPGRAVVCVQAEHWALLGIPPLPALWDPPLQKRAVGAALSVVLLSRGRDQLCSVGAASEREGNSFVAVVALNR